MLVRGIDPQARAGEEAEKLPIAQENIFVNVARKWLELKKVTTALTMLKISGVLLRRHPARLSPFKDITAKNLKPL